MGNTKCMWDEINERVYLGMTEYILVGMYGGDVRWGGKVGMYGGDRK